MGKQSTRENKTIYQLCREAAGLTRAEAVSYTHLVPFTSVHPEENFQLFPPAS